MVVVCRCVGDICSFISLMKKVSFVQVRTRVISPDMSFFSNSLLLVVYVCMCVFVICDAISGINV